MIINYVFCSLSELVGIKKLNLSANALPANLSDIFTKLTSLQSLDLCWCKMRTLPPRLVQSVSDILEILLVANDDKGLF